MSPPGVGKSRLRPSVHRHPPRGGHRSGGADPLLRSGGHLRALAELLAQAAGSPSGEAEMRGGAAWPKTNDAPRRASGGRPRRPGSWSGRGPSVGYFLGRASPASIWPRIVLSSWCWRISHWAEQPMLDLVDSVVERVHGPVLVLCLAPARTARARPTWGAGKPRAITATLPRFRARPPGGWLPCCWGRMLLSSSSIGSARRPRATRSTWNSSRRCWRIRGTSAAGAG